MHKLGLSRGAGGLLAGIAVALSAVTALSVALAMHALIADPLLAVVFAGAAVLLDLYKYLAWPMAACLLLAGKRMAAALMVATALVLAGVSGWATYDRLSTAMQAGTASQRAIVEQRMGDLRAQQADARARLASLDAQALTVGEQARQLRERGIVTKALELEAATQARIDSQRGQALARLDAASLELTALQSRPAPQAALPALLVVLLCAGFALALEVVPALIICAVRLGRAPVAEQATAVAADTDPEPGSKATPPATPAPAEAAAVTTPVVAQPVRTATVVPIRGQQQDLFGSPDAALYERLCRLAQAAPPGTPITVRHVTEAFRVGNRRAQRLFRTALDNGLMRKTTAGYVAA